MQTDKPLSHGLLLRLRGRRVAGITTETNYLVVGGELNPNWAHESYGRKIEKALVFKLDGRDICLIQEDSWVAAVHQYQSFAR